MPDLTCYSAAKPSKPGRAYIHVLKHDFATALGDKVRESTFHDAAKSWQDSALVGPPTLELAPYPKMPGGRRRHCSEQRRAQAEDAQAPGCPAASKAAAVAGTRPRGRHAEPLLLSEPGITCLRSHHAIPFRRGAGAHTRHGLRLRCPLRAHVGHLLGSRGLLRAHPERN